MQHRTNKPIFIVGSPRSGTSILTWCLGEHPNILPVPESNWMGEFAADVAISYQIGTARGNRSILSGMDIQCEEFFANFGRSIHDLILRHRKDLERKRKTKHSRFEPKARWVDGTPEYSFHIYGLRKLFPEALFIHILRDVTSVVRSMLNFHRVAGVRLVANEEEAYKYWLRTVKACLTAEQAYGPGVVHRLRYPALIDNPESAIRSLLDFIGEPYTAKCLEPLAQRINSSNVPPDFKTDDPATDPAIVEEAQRLSAEIEETAQPSEDSPAAADDMEAAFQRHLKSETEQLSALKLQIKRQEDHYSAEIATRESTIAELKTRLELQTQQLSEYEIEIEQLRDRITEETNRLRKQLWDTRRLSHLLDDVENAAARLRSSRRWKLANPGITIRAKISRGKVSMGYGHL
jgi:hypothetical protein